MSLMTTAHLLDRYGPLLTEEQLAQVLHVEPGTLRNTRAGQARMLRFDRRTGALQVGADVGAVG